jgi:osmotically-inducible protein OsmY
VTVAAQQGIVMLSGFVSSRLERERVVSIAWSTPGVTLVKVDLATIR